MLRLVRFSLLFLVDSPAIDFVIINVLLIITNHLIEIEIDRHHIILIGRPLIWSCFNLIIDDLILLDRLFHLYFNQTLYASKTCTNLE